MSVNTSSRARKTPLAISKMVLDAAYKIHTHFGPGLLESVYENCLAQELKSMGMGVMTQVPVPVIYEGTRLEVGYRIDLLVEDSVVVEVKSIEALAPIHYAQTLSYLKLSEKTLALLINFNVLNLKHGIKRFVIGNDWK